MAITIHQKPSTVLATFPAYDPAIYVVEESSIGLYKFSYTCAIEHYNGSSYDDVATLRVPKNDGDAGVFDVGEIVQAYMTQTRPASSGALLEPTGNAQRFRFTFGSEQAGTATGAPVANASTAQSTDDYYSGQGRLDKSGYAENNSTRFQMTTSATDRALTTSGWPQDAPRFEVRADQEGSIDFLYDTAEPAGSVSVIRLRFYNGGTQLSSNDIDISTYATGSDPANDVMRFWCYPKDLDDHGTGSQRPSNAANNGWTRYTVQFRSAASAESLLHTFVLVDDCTPQRLMFRWLNQFGGWEQMYMKGNWQIQTSYTDKTYSSVRGNWFTAESSTNFTYTSDARGMNRIVMDTERVYTVNTGHRINEDNARMESLLRSRSVFVNDPEVGEDSDAFYPCVLDSRSFVRFEQFHPDYREYSFTMKLANGPKAQVL